MVEKIKLLLQNSKNLIIIGVVILAIALPIIITQVLKQQNLRQGATGAPQIGVSVSPETKTVSVGDTFDVEVKIDAGTNDLGSLEFVLDYTKGYLEPQLVSQPSDLKLVKQIDGDGKTTYIMISTASTPITGNGIKVAVVRLKALKATSTGDFAKINISQSSVKSSTTGLYSSFVPLLSTPIEGKYTITDAQASPTTVGNSPSPTSSTLDACVNEMAGGGSIISCSNDNASLFFYFCNDGTNGVIGDSQTCQPVAQLTQQAKLKCNPTNATNAAVCLDSVSLVVNVYSDANKDGGGYDYLQGDRVIANVPVTVTTPLGTKSGKTDQYGKFYYSQIDSNATTGLELGDMIATITIPSGYTGNSTITYKVSNGTHGGADFPLTKVSSPTPTSTPIPTATLAPTATPAVGNKHIKFNVELPGIGNGAANLGLNPSPLRPQRSASVEILNNQNVSVTTGTGILTYSSGDPGETGRYSGLLDFGKIGEIIPAGNYNAKIKFDNTLFKIIPGIIQITNDATEHEAQTVTLVSGDLNSDNTLGVIDWTLMIACVKNEASCTESIRSLADLNDNGSIDETDVQILQRGFAIRDGD